MSDDDFNVAMDVYILVESADDIKKVQNLKLISDEAEIAATSQPLEQKDKKTTASTKDVPVIARQQPNKRVQFYDVAQLINGFGRIVEYNKENQGVPQLVRVLEGKFKDGQLDQYGRVYTLGGEDTLSVGQYTCGLLDGKGEIFKVDGTLAMSGIFEQGLLKKSIEIQTYERRAVAGLATTTTTAAGAPFDPREEKKKFKSSGLAGSSNPDNYNN